MSRHGPASSSAARRKTDARASHESADHSRRASAAAAIARATSSLAALVVLAEDVLMVVGHDDVGGAPGAHLLAADHHRDLDLPAGHLVEAGLEARPLRGTGRVVADRLVDRLGKVEDSCAHAAKPTCGATGGSLDAYAPAGVSEGSVRRSRIETMPTSLPPSTIGTCR